MFGAFKNLISRHKSRNDRRQNTHEINFSAYNLQISGTQAPSRNVDLTVRAQVVVVRHNIFKDLISNITSQRKLLADHSAIELPPAICAIFGLGTEPHRLYKTIALDRLHVFDLDIGRDLPDNVHNLFASPEYNKSQFSKSQAIRCVNSRIREMLIVRRLNISPFKTQVSEVHSRMYGLIRRKLFPFLAYYFRDSAKCKAL